MKRHLSRALRMGLRQAIVLGTVFPILFVTLGLLWQPHATQALQSAWPMMVLVFVIAAATAVLPGKIALIAFFVVLLGFMWLTGAVIPFGGFLVLCLVLAGFFFGLAVRSVVYQLRKQAKTQR